jgi:uncharacterized protein (DUF58 family)
VLLRRCTQGLCLLGLLLLSFAIVLDDMAILLAGGVLAFSMLGQYLIFDSNVRAIAGSVEIQRSLNRNPVRRGTAVHVTAQITITVPPHMQAEISDLIPSQVSLAGGTTTITARADPAPRTCSLDYQIVPMVHGLQPFSGMSIRIRNLFFEKTLELTNETYRQPVLSVMPSGMFAPAPLDYPDGSRENRKVSVWSGSDVHSLRDYATGDDLRHVDWKMTAKYDRIVIRKYSSLLSHPPLIIVDLPWNNADYPEKEFGRMIAEVSSMAGHTIENFQNVTVLLISGPNVIHLIREERNIARCIAELREWMHPAERTVHFYRMPDRADLRSCVRRIEDTRPDASNAPTGKFLSNLQDRYLSILQYHRNPAFSGQVMRTLARIPISEAYLFSLGCGDTSHLRHVVRPLKFQSIKVYVRILGPARTDDTSVSEDPARSAPGVPS